MSLKTHERRKYEKMWGISDYRIFAPGETHADDAIEDMTEGCEVIDFGAGTGRGALKIHKSGHTVTMIDLADNCLDPGVKKHLGPGFSLMEHCLWDELFLEADYGYCTDVMEHIPPEKVDAVLDNIKKCVPHGYFNISTIQDSFGALIGEPLHLTVEPWSFWVGKIQERWGVKRVKLDPGEVSIWF